MIEFLTTPALSLSIITVVSLLVNAVTIYRWISEKKEVTRVNDQAYHMIWGLALASSQRGSMVISRMNTLKAQGKQNEESMIFLENMFADTSSNVENLLAAAKALKPENAQNLPFDGRSLTMLSMIESAKLEAKRNEMTKQQHELAQDQ